VFETLGNRRRRYVLHFLKQQDVEGPVTIRELSEQLAAWENGVDCTAVEPKQRKRLYTALHQTHLPKMSQLGIVEYDHAGNTVAIGDSLDQFDIYFDLRRTDDIPWSRVYLGIGGVVAAAVLAASLAVWPFALLSGFGYATATAALLIAVGGYHAFHDNRPLLGHDAAPPEVDFPRKP
jgi:hypothetical protein